MVVRIVGIILMIAGVVLVINPELVIQKPIPSDTFEAIERRIWWGLLIGAGVFLLFYRERGRWLRTVVAIGIAILFGLLVARLIGIILDGSVVKQWIYVGIEGAIMALLVWWYRNIRKTSDELKTAQQ